MATSVFIARIFGLCYLVIGVGFLANRKFFRRVMDDFSKNTAVLLYGGLMALVIGVVIILTHNVWEGGWPVVITVIGWVGFLKGVWMIVFPTTVPKFLRAYQKNGNLLMFQGIGALSLGVVLTYFGFFAG